MDAMNIQVNVDARAAVAVLRDARGVMQAREAAHKVAASAVGRQVRGWFLDRNARSQTSNYWSRAAEATTAEWDAAGGAVVVRHPGVGWHLRGGTIVPSGRVSPATGKPVTTLAIPLKGRSGEGIWPRERFQDDAEKPFVWRRSGKAFLAVREGNALRLLYLLVKSVSKGEDPSVLPPGPEMAAEAAQAVLLLVRRTLRQRMKAT
jgi:hypothetical protein